MKNKQNNIFWVIVQKEITDHIRNWRFIILSIIILLTCISSMYTTIVNISKAIKSQEIEGAFYFLRLFTTGSESLPSFIVFLGFLGPLLGIALGFDAINSEQNRGTLIRVLAQPIPRDYIINAKFIAALIVISVMFFTLGFLILGLGFIIIGFPPTPEEFLRIIFFIILSIIYVAFWLNMSIYFSLRFRQPATSALAGIAVWLFCSVFYVMIVDLLIKIFIPSETSSIARIIHPDYLRILLLRILPNELYNEATTTLLMPSIRSLGPLTYEKVYGTIPNPLSLTQSLLLICAHITALIAGTIIFFVLSYTSFMKREIRPR